MNFQTSKSNNEIFKAEGPCNDKDLAFSQVVYWTQPVKLSSKIHLCLKRYDIFITWNKVCINTFLWLKKYFSCSFPAASPPEVSFLRNLKISSIQRSIFSPSLKYSDVDPDLLIPLDPTLPGSEKTESRSRSPL